MKPLTTYDIKTMFKIAYNNQTNLMTPEVIKYGVKKDYVYELSTGEGFNREPIYGVTILDRLNGNKRHDLNKCFGTEDKAYNYIENLGAEND